MKESTIKQCVKCGDVDSIFVPDLSLAVTHDGVVIWGGRQLAFCNNCQCDQRYWWYPRSGRITRRNTGQTYPEWSRMRGHGLPLIPGALLGLVKAEVASDGGLSPPQRARAESVERMRRFLSNFPVVRRFVEGP